MNHPADAFAKRFPLIYQLFTDRLKYSLAAMAALFIGLAVILYGQLVYESEDLFTKAGPIIGGDFMVFRHAAEVAGTPEMTSIYTMDNLSAQLQAKYPGHGDFLFGWMYPPTMSLLIKPFAYPPYLASYALWVALFAGAYFFAVSRLWADKWALFFMASSPAVFQGVITGQNGFLTGALMIGAGAFADKRPIVAGLAAGLLTIKPQFGLLIPIAFIAAGCWRAFLVAAATAIIFAFLAWLTYGTESWIGFYEGLTAHGARMAVAGFPFNKLVTPFGFAAMLGAPATIASAVQAAASLSLALIVFVAWRRIKAADMRYAVLATSAILATPYAFYYELALIAPAAMVIARRATQSGWLKYEKIMLIAIWILPLMMPGPGEAPNLSNSATGALLAFALVTRRALPEAGFRFASAASPARAGS